MAKLNAVRCGVAVLRRACPQIGNTTLALGTFSPPPSEPMRGRCYSRVGSQALTVEPALGPYHPYFPPRIASFACQAMTRIDYALVDTYVLVREGDTPVKEAVHHRDIAYQPEIKEMWRTFNGRFGLQCLFGL